MKINNKTIKYLLSGIGCGIACFIFTNLLIFSANFVFPGIVVRANQIWVDYLYQYRQDYHATSLKTMPMKNIAIVLFDDESNTKLKAFWPYDRSEIAKVINFLSLSQTKSLVFDILFANPKANNPESDKLLIESIEKAPNDILGSKFIRGKNESKEDKAYLKPFAVDIKSPKKLDLKEFRLYKDNIQQYNAPFENLQNKASGIGFFNSERDIDNVKRSNNLILCGKSLCFPSLSLSFYLNAIGTKKIEFKPKESFSIEDNKIPLSSDNKIFINWLGGTKDIVNLEKAIEKVSDEDTPESKKKIEDLKRLIDYKLLYTYKVIPAWKLIISYNRILDYAKKLNITPDEVFELWKNNDKKTSGLKFYDPNIFKNKIVVMGVSSSGAQDFITSPFGNLPGVFNHAYLIDNIISKNYINHLNTSIELILLFFLCTITATSVFIASSRDSVLYLILPLAYVTLFTIFSMEAFGLFNTVINYFQPILGIMLSAFGSISFYFILEGKNKKQIKEAMSNYLSPQVMKAVLENPDQLKPSASKRQPLTILFSDIRGFTTFSENNPSELVVRMLNEYLFTMTNIIFKYNGTLDKFIGDAIMAFWGAPILSKDHPKEAVLTALKMKEKLNELNLEWERVYKHTFKIGIGINTEEVVVGNIGSEKFMNYTTIGDGVNLASRLESLNKTYETTIIISENTYRYVKDIVEVRFLDTVKVKGKSEETKIYELLGLKENYKES